MPYAAAGWCTLRQLKIRQVNVSLDLLVRVRSISSSRSTFVYVVSAPSNDAQHSRSENEMRISNVAICETVAPLSQNNHKIGCAVTSQAT